MNNTKTRFDENKTGYVIISEIICNKSKKFSEISISHDLSMEHTVRRNAEKHGFTVSKVHYTIEIEGRICKSIMDDFYSRFGRSGVIEKSVIGDGYTQTAYIDDMLDFISTTEKTRGISFLHKGYGSVVIN